jgi:hypothetical protein
MTKSFSPSALSSSVGGSVSELFGRKNAVEGVAANNKVSRKSLIVSIVVGLLDAVGEMRENDGRLRYERDCATASKKSEEKKTVSIRQPSFRFVQRQRTPSDLAKYLSVGHETAIHQ